MKKALLIAGIVVLFLATSLISFRYGVAVQSKNIAHGLSETQAMLWFNHLLTFQEIESNLVSGCSDVALENVRDGIDQEMGLLSSHIKETPNSWVIKYMADRDSTILERLASFKSRHGSSWVVPKCVPPSNQSFKADALRAQP